MKINASWRAEKDPRVNRAIVTDPRGTWRRFAVLLWRSRLPIVLIVILFVVSKSMVDVGLDQTKYTAQMIAGDVSVEVVMLLVVAMLVSWALGTVSGLLAGIIQQLINRNLRRLVWRSIVRLPASFFQQAPPREAVSRITTDTEDMGRFLMVTVYPMVIAAYSTYAVAARVAQYDLRLSGVIIAFVPLQVLLSWGIGRFEFYTKRDVTVRNASLTQRLAEYVANIPLIKMFAVAQRERQRGNGLIRDLYQARVRTGVVSAVSTSLFSAVGLVQTVLLIAVGVYLINEGAIQTPQWVAFFLYSGTVSTSVGGLITSWTAVKAIQGTTARIAEIVYAKPESSGTAPMPTGGSDIVVEGLSYAYDGEQVITDLTHTFARNKLTVVVGPSGSGKSTLVRLMLRLHEPTAGQVIVHGRPAPAFELTSYRAAFACVGQDGPIISGTVRENLTLGSDRTFDDDQLIEALCLDGDRDFLANLPDGLDTQAGDYGSKLSGGQRHRIAIARALLRDAPFVVLDEPTAALDSTAEMQALQRIRYATQGRTTILIAHRPAAVAVADEVVVVEDGRVTAAGTPDEVATRSAFIREAFATGGIR